MIKDCSKSSTLLRRVPLIFGLMLSCIGADRAQASSHRQPAVAQQMAEAKAALDSQNLSLILLPSASNEQPMATGLSTDQLIERDEALGLIDTPTADLYLTYALGGDSRLPVNYQSDVPWRGTAAAWRVSRNSQAAALSRLLAPSSAFATEIYARIRAIDAVAPCGSGMVGFAGIPSTIESAHFHVEYDPIAAPLTIASYVTSLEHAWTTEIDSFGQYTPLLTTGVNGKFYVSIVSLGNSLYGYDTNGGLHGSTVPVDNPSTPWLEPGIATCITLNSDFSFASNRQAALDATTAHEFFHAIQFGMGVIEPETLVSNPQIGPIPLFSEAAATLMEDEVADSSNDNYNYLWPNLKICLGDDHIDPTQRNVMPYRYWVLLRGMTERYGHTLPGGIEQWLQDVLIANSRDRLVFLDAYQQAFVNRGTTLADAFHNAAITISERKQCGGGYGYPTCFSEAIAYNAYGALRSLQGADATLSGINSSFSGSLPDNFTAGWLNLPKTSSKYKVQLVNTSAGGEFHASLVCDTGSALQVTALSSLVIAGQQAASPSFSSAGCNSVLLVITNQFQTAANPTTCSVRSYKVTVLPDAPVITSPVTGSVTGSNAPKISGIAAPFDTITVTQPGATVCVAPVAANGGWTCTPAAAFPIGRTTITATASHVLSYTISSSANVFTVAKSYYLPRVSRQ